MTVLSKLLMCADCRHCLALEMVNVK